MPKNKKRVAELIQLFRKRSNFSRTDLARKIALKTVTSITEFEKPQSKTNPSSSRCLLIANALNLTRAETDELIEAAGHPKLDERLVNTIETAATERFSWLLSKSSVKRVVSHLNDKMKVLSDLEAEKLLSVVDSVILGWNSL